MSDKTRRIIQINVNHSARAQDLLIQTMAEWDIDLGIIAEPYLVPLHRDNWAGDNSGSMAIVTRKSGHKSQPCPFTVESKGDGFIVTKWDELVIVGVYFSPNKNLAMFERFLDRIETAIRRFLFGSVIIAGDWNAKSTVWGSPITDSRGEILTDWMLELGFACQNKGTTQTCVRQKGGSIINVTLTISMATRRIEDWWVEEETERLFPITGI